MINFKLIEGKRSMDLRGGFMKLFNILLKYLTAFNYGGWNLNEIIKELKFCTLEFEAFWDKESKGNPTN